MASSILPELPLGAQVELRRDIPDLGLRAGERGVICGVGGPTQPYEVEFTVRVDRDSVDISACDFALVPRPGDAPIEEYRQHLLSLSGELLEHVSTVFADEPGRKPAPWHGLIPAVHVFARGATPTEPLWYAFCAPSSASSVGIIARAHSGAISDAH